MNISRDSSPLETLVQAIGVGLAGVSDDGRQTFVNEAFCKMLGYPANVLVGASPPFCYWSEHTRNEVLESLDHALKGAFPSAGRRLIFRRKSGEQFPVLVHVSATTGPGKTAWLSTVVDLSELEKRAVKAETQSQTLMDAQKLARLGTWEVRGGDVILSK